MDAWRTADVLRQVCHSLGEAHARNLVHRDVKPANIMVCRLGPDKDFVKVLDFGLVKHTTTAPTITMLSVEGTVMGTPTYMAPEIALGHANVDGRADIYSLGCVAYYLLTGQPVFSGDTPLATALAHVKNAPVPPRLRSEFSVPPALDALIMECVPHRCRAQRRADRRTPAPDVQTPQGMRAAVPIEARAALVGRS